MLRASAMTQNGPLIVCGLSDGNIDRLRSGSPIKASFESFGLSQRGTLTIVWGPTEQAMEATFRQHGLIGDDTKTTADPALDQMAEAIARSNKILIMTMGLPRSGKSTWAKIQSWPIVNPDSVRLAMHGQRFAPEAEQFVWAAVDLMIRSLFLSGHKIVILDATNVSRKRRDRFQSKDWTTFIKLIDTPAQTCIDRANAEKDTVIIDVINRMGSEWEAPGKDELLWPSPI